MPACLAGEVGKSGCRHGVLPSPLSQPTRPATTQPATGTSVSKLFQGYPKPLLAFKLVFTLSLRRRGNPFPLITKISDFAKILIRLLFPHYQTKCPLFHVANFFFPSGHAHLFHSFDKITGSSCPIVNEWSSHSNGNACLYLTFEQHACCYPGWLASRAAQLFRGFSVTFVHFRHSSPMMILACSWVLILGSFSSGRRSTSDYEPTKIRRSFVYLTGSTKAFRQWILPVEPPSCHMVPPEPMASFLDPSRVL